MNSILLALALSASPSVVHCFTSDNCPFCRQVESGVGYGNGSLTVLYHYNEPLPAGATGYPAFLDSTTGRVLTGYHTVDQLEAWIDSGHQPVATGAAAHTPLSEVVRVIRLLPRPQVGFVDFGCGYDARWCVAAAEHWGCRVTGIENDHERATAARERVHALGLDHLITIVEGDVHDAVVSADVGVAYLYPETLASLRPRLQALAAFASYLHQPAGLPVVKNGDSWVYLRQQAVTSRPLAQWGGQYYSGPVCMSGNCPMCQSIRVQLGIR